MFKKTFLALLSLTFFQCQLKGGSDEEEPVILDQKGVEKEQNKKEHSLINVSHNIFNNELIQLREVLTQATNEDLKSGNVEFLQPFMGNVIKKMIKALIGVVVENSNNKNQMQKTVLEDVFPKGPTTRSLLWKKFFAAKEKIKQNLGNVEQVLVELAQALIDLNKEYRKLVEPKKVKKFEQEWDNVCSQVKEFYLLARNEWLERSKLIV